MSFVRHVSATKTQAPFKKKNIMPLDLILVVKLFDVMGIDFMGPFPPSYGFHYILVVFNYVSKRIEAIPWRNNDAYTF